jgi:hypothetical protein
VRNKAFVVDFPHVLAAIHACSRQGRHDDVIAPCPPGLGGLGRIDQDGIGIGLSHSELSSAFNGGMHSDLGLSFLEVSDDGWIVQIWCQQNFYDKEWTCTRYPHLYDVSDEKRKRWEAIERMSESCILPLVQVQIWCQPN